MRAMMKRRMKRSGEWSTSLVPSSTTNVFLLYAMRYQWLSNVVRFNERLPCWMIDTEHGLVFLRALISLFCYTSRCGGCCDVLV